MELKFVASPKREIRSFLRGRNHRNAKNNLLESIAQANGGSVVSSNPNEGVVRLKFIVRKQDLKEVMEMIRAGKNNPQQPPSSSSSVSLEQRLNLLQRKQLSRSNAMKMKERRLSSWTPALQSIPEEL